MIAGKYITPCFPNRSLIDGKLIQDPNLNINAKYDIPTCFNIKPFITSATSLFQIW